MQKSLNLIEAGFPYLVLLAKSVFFFTPKRKQKIPICNPKELI